MLKELKTAMRITKDSFDALLADFLVAGAKDLESVDVILPGTVSFTVSENEQVTDTSTLTDKKVMKAVLTYAAESAERFWNGPSAEKLKASYNEQKADLMHDSNYTNYGESDA